MSHHTLDSTQPSIGLADLPVSSETPLERATFPHNHPLEYGDWKTDVHALGYPHGAPISKALAYVIANGFKQSLTDASARTTTTIGARPRSAAAMMGPMREIAAASSTPAAATLGSGSTGMGISGAPMITAGDQQALGRMWADMGEKGGHRI